MNATTDCDMILVHLFWIPTTRLYCDLC